MLVYHDCVQETSTGAAAPEQKHAIHLLLGLLYHNLYCSSTHVLTGDSAADLAAKLWS